MVICLERCADLHMAQLMPLPLTVSWFYLSMRLTVNLLQVPRTNLIFCSHSFRAAAVQTVFETPFRTQSVRPTYLGLTFFAAP